jgi:hypothetical protein
MLVNSNKEYRINYHSESSSSTQADIISVKRSAVKIKIVRGNAWEKTRNKTIISRMCGEVFFCLYI